MWFAGKGFSKASDDVMECKKFEPISEWSKLESCVEGVRDDICSGVYNGKPETDCSVMAEAVKWVGMVEVLNEIYCAEYGCRKEIAGQLCKYYDGDYNECVNFYVPSEDVKKRGSLPELPPISSKRVNRRQNGQLLRTLLREKLNK